MIVRGRATVGLDFDAPRQITVRNEDALRGTFVDLVRPATGQAVRRCLEPGEREVISLAPGPVDLALGESAVLEVEDDTGS